jgi:LmbE family N-acetylglucosaminyl deacetylase
MMMPVTQEAVWMEVLGGIPSWHPPLAHTVVIAPHPDDETLGAGGLIAAQRRRGVPVLILGVTDGEAAYPNSPNLGQVRAKERSKAMAELGVPITSIVRLRMPDSSLSFHEETLEGLIRPLIPADALVLAPWRFDPHPDHEACGRAAERLAASGGYILLSYFFWTWHQCTPERLKGLPLRRFVLDGQMRASREAALMHYNSQLTHNRGEAILPDVTLLPARRPFETFLLHGSHA